MSVTNLTVRTVAPKGDIHFRSDKEVNKKQIEILNSRLNNHLVASLWGFFNVGSDDHQNRYITIIVILKSLIKYLKENPNEILKSDKDITSKKIPISGEYDGWDIKFIQTYCYKGKAGSESLHINDFYLQKITGGNKKTREALNEVYAYTKPKQAPVATTNSKIDSHRKIDGPLFHPFNSIGNSDL